MIICLPLPGTTSDYHAEQPSSKDKANLDEG